MGLGSTENTAVEKEDTVMYIEKQSQDSERVWMPSIPLWSSAALH